MCNCSGGKLEQFAGTLFENGWNNSYATVGAIDNYKPNKTKMRGGTRATVPDGTADGKISRLFWSNIVVPNAAWFEVKAMDGTLYNSTSKRQIKGHITNLGASVPSMYRRWGLANASAASLTFVNTFGVSISSGTTTLASIYNIILYQYTAQYMVSGSTMMVRFQLSTQNGIRIPNVITTPPVPLR